MAYVTIFHRCWYNRVSPLQKTAPQSFFHKISITQICTLTANNFWEILHGLGKGKSSVTLETPTNSSFHIVTNSNNFGNCTANSNTGLNCYLLRFFYIQSTVSQKKKNGTLVQFTAFERSHSDCTNINSHRKLGEVTPAGGQTSNCWLAS